MVFSFQSAQPRFAAHCVSLGLTFPNIGQKGHHQVHLHPIARGDHQREQWSRTIDKVPPLRLRYDGKSADDVHVVRLSGPPPALFVK